MGFATAKPIMACDEVDGFRCALPILQPDAQSYESDGQPVAAQVVMMWIPSRVIGFFRALCGTVLASIERMTTEEEGYQRIQFTESYYGLYLRFRGQQFQIRSGSLEMTSVALSLDEV